MSIEPPRRTRGSCLCGSCTFVLIGEPIISAECHCDSCKKTSGSNCMWVLLYDKDRVDVLPSSALQNYTDRTGSRDIYREFCSVCGSPMFRKMQGLSVVLIAGGTVAESKVTNGHDHDKGKSPMLEWEPEHQAHLCSDVFEGLTRPRPGPRR